MARDLKPETLAKKCLAFETLPEFLARMTLVWEERQRRLAQAPAKAAEAARRSLARAMARDPEGVAARRRAASARYEERNRKALRERERVRRQRLAAALAVARSIKRAEKAAQREADKARQLAEKEAKRQQGTGAARPKCQPRSRDVPVDEARGGPSAPVTPTWCSGLSTLPVLGGKALSPSLAVPGARSCGAAPACLEKQSSAASD